jgi:hypothetical protein
MTSVQPRRSNDGMSRFAWIIVAALLLLVAFALGWSFTHLEQGT